MNENVEVKVVGKDEAASIVLSLNANSNLKDGAVIVSLFELEQLLALLPEATQEQSYIKNVAFQAFSRVVGKIYMSASTATSQNFGELFIADMELARKLILKGPVQ